MSEQLTALLYAYASREVDLEVLRTWIAAHIWEPEPEAEETINDVGAQLAHLDDGLIDEDRFRDFAAAIFTKGAGVTIFHTIGAVGQTAPASEANGTAALTFDEDRFLEPVNSPDLSWVV